MAPHVNRYGPQGLSNPYSHIQQNHIHQQHPHPANHQSTHNSGLPPPNLSNTAFGQGSGSNSSPFAMGSSLNGGFDRGLADGANGGLASHAAQMNFARGGLGQQQYVAGNNERSQAGTAKKDESRIRNVWKSNLRQELVAIQELVDEFPYIAMDTEFPGIVARPVGNFTTKADYHYQTLRCNVDLLKIIQLGISLFKHDGSLPPEHPDPSKAPAGHNASSNMQPAPYSWQFNFNFSLVEDMYAQDSMSMLTAAGIDFAAHKNQGIDPNAFGASFMGSGLVGYDDVHWVSFHSGYDFGYLMKLMLAIPLPDDESVFHSYREKFFPSLYDIKFLVKHASRNMTVNDNQPVSSDAQLLLQRLSNKSGLQDLAKELEVRRIGTAHQAGSDALLTGAVYFKLREKIFGGYIDPDKYEGQIWGLNAQMPTYVGNRDLSTPNMNGATFYSANGTPSTPQTGNVAPTNVSQGGAGGQGQNRTPVPLQSSHGTGGHLTPGGGSFGNFQYAMARN